MIGQWFVLSDGVVKGPWTQDGIESEAAKLNSPLIWGRGQPEWLTIDKWRKHLSQSAQTQTNPTLERLWRVRIGEQELAPMTYDRMVDTLQGRNDHNQVLIWTEGYSEWREIYQIHRLMDELGVGRRAHPRVPIVGSVQCEATTGQFVAQALSISEGGLGITECPNVKIGEKMKVSLKSPNLFNPILATAEVVYVGLDGYIGMRFIGLQTESKSAIIEYVKKFVDAKPG